MFLLPLLVFLTVSLALVGVFFWLMPTRTEQRLQAMTNPGEKSTWVESVVGLVGPFAKLSTPAGDWDRSPLRLSFINAGIRHPDAPLIYFGAKSLLPLLFAAAAFAALKGTGNASGLVLVLWLMISALVGCYLPNLALSWQVGKRKQEVFENFPDATDLMLVCVEAGLSLDSAMTRVAEEMKLKSMALAEELHLTNLEMRAGASREKSLRNLALRTGIEEVGTFATMLTQADKFGTSVGDSLRVFSDDLRHKRQTRAEEAAAKVSTKMLVPLVLFIFPSIIMVILGPAGIQVIRTLLPMLGGGQ
jgi:tight adherence protein C